MKYAKKTMAIICAASCAAMSFAFAACGGDGGGATVSGEKIAEQQWTAALDDKAFDNVTAEMIIKSRHSGNSLEESYDYTEIQTRLCKFDNSSGSLYVQDTFEYESYGNKKLPAYLEDSDDRYLFIKQGDVVKRYNYLDDGKLEFDGKDSYLYDVYINTVVKCFVAYHGMYSSFSYDKKTGEFNYTMQTGKISLKFENQKLVQGSANITVAGGCENSYKYYDYGTTTVDISADLPI